MARNGGIEIKRSKKEERKARKVKKKHKNERGKKDCIHGV